ncbi:MAG: hypothetical protein IKR26_04475 [Lachnospiraceae bacterium]|nr:hypothetical protein [Lachnospiraceae bacterium]
MTKEEISKEIKECEQKLAKLREEMNKPEYGGKRWKPENGEEYYCISPNGKITRDLFFYECVSDVYLCGNCFKTREVAEFVLERRKVIAELSDYAEGDDAVWDGNIRHFYILYSFDAEKIIYDYWYTWKPAQLCFPSKEAAKAAVEAVGEERVKKYYLGVW